MIFDLTIAMGGLLLAVFSFLAMNEATQVSTTQHQHEQGDGVDLGYSGGDPAPAQRRRYETEGPFFFVANKFDEVMAISTEVAYTHYPDAKVPFIDSTGLNNLETLCRNSIKEKKQVILSGVNSDVREKIEQSAIPGIIGQENICDNIHLAVKRAVQIDNELKEKQQEHA